MDQLVSVLSQKPELGLFATFAVGMVCIAGVLVMYKVLDAGVTIIRGYPPVHEIVYDDED